MLILVMLILFVCFGVGAPFLPQPDLILERFALRGGSAGLHATRLQSVRVHHLEPQRTAINIWGS
jgi:hypothetical protein